MHSPISRVSWRYLFMNFLLFVEKEGLRGIPSDVGGRRTIMGGGRDPFGMARVAVLVARPASCSWSVRPTVS